VTVARARLWRPLSRQAVRRRAEVLPARSLFDVGPDTRTAEERDAEQRAHRQRVKHDEHYRMHAELGVVIGHARLDDDDFEDQPSPSPAAPKPSTVAAPVAPRARQRSRRSRRTAAAKKASSSDDGPTESPTRRPEIAAFVTTVRRVLVAQVLADLGVKGRSS
jgi:hypothetical protein